jgi:DNA-binding CsgD family transcriptional regulator
VGEDTVVAMTALMRGRGAFDREAWSDAFQQLSAADQEVPLAAEDLERLGMAAFLSGHPRECAAVLARAHQAHLDEGDPARAAASAFWLAFGMLEDPAQRAQAGGWLGRAQRLLDEHQVGQCAERGFLACAAAFQRLTEGKVPEALQAFEEAVTIGRACGNRDLTALARHGQGRVLLRLNHPTEGLAILDEVMVSVTCGEVGPIVAGIVYCSVISACQERFDLRRAQEWTSALARWCDAHPQMAAFQGACLVHRAEVLQWHGAWPAAMAEARRACDWPDSGSGPAHLGAALYQAGEIHRLRGEFGEAEDAYRRANQAGRAPDPGYALLRLAQGQVEAAAASIRRVAQESRGPRTRPLALRAAVEILTAAGDLAGARGAAEELARLAIDRPAPFLRAAAAHAGGVAALAAGHAAGAVGALRDAWAAWQEVNAPYEIAQVRAWLGLAYRTLGDEDGAQLEFDAAQQIFEQLGAAFPSPRIAELLAAPAPAAAGGLTGREVEVLRLVAAGKTNRAIAASLAISEKTVARHLSNIFTKLDLPSRTAATAYAYEHKLV